MVLDTKQFLARSAVQISHGGSQGFKSPHLHPTYALVTGLAACFRRAEDIPAPLSGQWTTSIEPTGGARDLSGSAASSGGVSSCGERRHRFGSWAGVAL
jgi:hypothetical protein